MGYAKGWPNRTVLDWGWGCPTAMPKGQGCGWDWHSDWQSSSGLARLSTG